MDIPVRIVLVETSHPGNIGAVARAMKTMGLSDLRLVNPKTFPSDEATARSSGAEDVLARAEVCQTLVEAIADCGYVVGASARLRGMRWPAEDPRAMAANVWDKLRSTNVALVMGPEQSGLTNEDMSRCHALVHIPTHPNYSSLNLAMAVQVLCYELRMAPIENRLSEQEARDAPPATSEQIEGLHAHLEQVLAHVGFLNSDHPNQLRHKLRRLFTRAHLDQSEINILRGALASLDPRIEGRGSKGSGEESGQ
jgi:tRNA (cytidine32/uridine32-2'-O)-methyltransferase